ncbi:MAG: hypothetical protein HY372_00615 [Candidatus Andersenbacteria bacterium]|nr:hypothetical protein [Candidatus Andersenbacteria bacterium]
MPKTPTRLLAIALPVLLLGTVQLGGCLRRSIPPPPPGGVYRSVSGGAQFVQSVRLLDDDAKLIGYIAELAVHSLHRTTTNPQVVYITAGQQGIYRSSDEGENWQAVAQPLTVATSVVELTNGVLLASGTNSGEGIVTRSLDHGASWERVLTMPALYRKKKALFEIIKPPPPPPVYVSSMVPDPFDPERVYATTSTGEVLSGEQSGKLWRTLIRVQSGQRDPLTNQAIASIRKIFTSPHRANELLVITTSGGLVRYRDGELKTFELPQGTVVDASYIAQFPEALFVGTDRGAIISRDSGSTWQELDLPISGSAPVRSVVVRVSPTNPTRLLIAVDSIIYRSEDGGQTFNTLSLGLPGHLITDLSIHPANAAHVLLSAAPAPT